MSAAVQAGVQLRARDVPPRAAWALEQAGVHPLLARLLAARGVRRAAELDPALSRLLPPVGPESGGSPESASGLKIYVFAEFPRHLSAELLVHGHSYIGLGGEYVRRTVSPPCLSI